MPSFAERTLSTFAQITLPAALLAIGASLAVPLSAGAIVPAVIASLIKVAVAPLVGAALLLLLDISAAEKLVVMLFLACPTAISSHIYSQQLNADEHLSASIVVISTLLSMFSLSIVILIF